MLSCMPQLVSTILDFWTCNFQANAIFIFIAQWLWKSTVNITTHWKNVVKSMMVLVWLQNQFVCHCCHINTIGMLDLQFSSKCHLYIYSSMNLKIHSLYTNSLEKCCEKYDGSCLTAASICLSLFSWRSFYLKSYLKQLMVQLSSTAISDY